MVTHKINKLSWAGPDRNKKESPAAIPSPRCALACWLPGEVKPASYTCAGDHFRTAPLSCFKWVFKNYYFLTIFLTFPSLRAQPGLGLGRRWPPGGAASLRLLREGAPREPRPRKGGICTIFLKKGRFLVFDLPMLASLISREKDFLKRQLTSNP